MTRRLLALGTSILAAAALAACSGTAQDPRTSAAPTTQAAVSAPTVEPTEAPSEEPTAAPSDEPTIEPSNEPTADVAFAQPGEIIATDDWVTVAGGDLFLSDLQTSANEVTAHFDGNGPLSFEAKYVDVAYTMGKGDAMEIDGANAYFQVAMAGFRIPEPSDDLVTEASGEGLPLLVDIPFEGMSTIVIGLSEEVPFAVTVTENPVTLTIIFEN